MTERPEMSERHDSELHTSWVIHVISTGKNQSASKSFLIILLPPLSLQIIWSAARCYLVDLCKKGWNNENLQIRRNSEVHLSQTCIKWPLRWALSCLSSFTFVTLSYLDSINTPKVCHRGTVLHIKPQRAAEACALRGTKATSQQWNELSFYCFITHADCEVITSSDTWISGLLRCYWSQNLPSDWIFMAPDNSLPFNCSFMCKSNTFPPRHNALIWKEYFTLFSLNYPENHLINSETLKIWLNEIVIIKLKRFSFKKYFWSVLGSFFHWFRKSG